MELESLPFDSYPAIAPDPISIIIMSYYAHTILIVCTSTLILILCPNMKKNTTTSVRNLDFRPKRVVDFWKFWITSYASIMALKTGFVIFWTKRCSRYCASLEATRDQCIRDAYRQLFLNHTIGWRGPSNKYFRWILNIDFFRDHYPSSIDKLVPISKK